MMNDQAKPVYDPQDLERLLVSRELAGDVDGMVALYEPHAILDYGGGQLVVGREAIRKFFAGLIAAGRNSIAEINGSDSERRFGTHFNASSGWHCNG